jgi:ABC-2 type transport system ATP-binding protein
MTDGLEKTVAVILVENLYKRFAGTAAVSDLSFAVRPGVVTGFLGPNGAGKTTTIRAIMGLESPTSGRATIGGLAYRDLPVPLRAVGALLDARAAHPGRDARSHLASLAAANRLAKSRVDEVLALVGLEAVADRRAGTFSLGMGQRLGIAAALLGDPAVLVFDEPTNGLDPEGILWIRNLMRDLAAEGRAVLVSSHLMSEMALTADHLIVIGRGRLIADEPLEAFVARTSTETVLVRTPEPGRLAAVLSGLGAYSTAGPYSAEGDGVLEVVGVEPRVIGDAALAAGVAVHELTPVRSSLEEAFMELTRDCVEYAAGPVHR